MSSISQINELIQKTGVGAPVYAFDRTGGGDHAPIFTCTLSVVGQTSKSGPKQTKKEAKEDAASKWLQIFGCEERETEVDDDGPTTTRYQTVHLDVENRPRELDKLLAMKKRGQIECLMVYAAEAWPGLDQVRERCKNVATLLTIDSGIKSAADVLMVVEVTKLITNGGPSVTHTIVSGDKLFYAFKDVIGGRVYLASRL